MLNREALSTIHIGNKQQTAGARIQRVRTTSASKTHRTIKGRHEGKSQARKSYCRE